MLGNGLPFAWGEFDPLNDLELDPLNPRLPREHRGTSQSHLLEVMISKFDVASLAESIVTAGYLEFDPIAGWPTQGRIRIREGNRRVAAVKMLLDPTLAPDRHQAAWQDLAARLPDEIRLSLLHLKVQVWNDPEAIELSAYIGYRHVTGVRPWPAVQKARYIAYLIEEEGLDYGETARRIGTKPRHVERHYLAYRMVDQALSQGVPGAEEMEDAFGVLLRSLQAKGIPEFLGVAYTGAPQDARTPIPDDKAEAFAEFVRWTFGAPDSPKVLQDSRDLTKWARVLSSTRALAYLRRTPEPDFSRAWERSGGEAESLAEMLMVAADNLREAVPIVADHADDQEVLDAATDCARFFARLVRDLPDVAQRAGLVVADG